MSTASKLNRILTTKSDLKTALVNKGQDVTDETPFKNYASYIANLDNTSDANATASDIAENKTAYVNGVKVTGNVSTVSAGTALERYTSDVTYFSNRDVMFLYTFPEATHGSDVLFRANSSIQLWVPQASIAQRVGLTADKIKEDTTILGVTGTYDGGVAAALSASY